MCIYNYMYIYILTVIEITKSNNGTENKKHTNCQNLYTENSRVRLSHWIQTMS